MNADPKRIKTCDSDILKRARAKFLQVPNE